jgi:hypothetical protein
MEATNTKISITEAEVIFGAKLPEFLRGSEWLDGKFVREIAIKEQVEAELARLAKIKADREATKVARAASNAAFVSRVRQHSIGD